MSETNNPCPYSKKCGGCRLQNLSYTEQLQLKQGRLIRTLGKFGHVNDIIGMDDPLHYRNKVHSAFGMDRRRKPVAGIYRAESHEIIPVEDCMIEDEISSSIIRDIKNMLPEFKIRHYDEQNGTGYLRHVLVKRGFCTGEVMVVLVVSSPIFKLQKPFLTKLLSAHPEITTVILNINDRFGPVVLGEREKILFGPGYIEDELCGHRFRISAKSFYQINPVQTTVLYTKAVEFAALTGKETVLDAYCGIGTIGITAAPYAGQVIGVEINKDAVHDAIANAKLNGIKNCWFSCGDASEYLVGMAKEKFKPDVVFMDPPRAGSDEKFISSLLKCAPEKIVYISCNPETLARDLEMITAGGYKVMKIQPVDMFPYTDHVETVVLLSQQRPNDKIRVELDLTEFDITAPEKEATYQEIKDFILEKHGTKVSSLYIALVKEKMEIKERENYNLPRSADTKQPKCPLEKEKLIIEALRHFQMI